MKQVVAEILHYLILATFLWMGVEAVNLYSSVFSSFQGVTGMMQDVFCQSYVLLHEVSEY